MNPKDCNGFIVWTIRSSFIKLINSFMISILKTNLNLPCNVLEAGLIDFIFSEQILTTRSFIYYIRPDWYISKIIKSYVGYKIKNLGISIFKNSDKNRFLIPNDSEDDGYTLTIYWIAFRTVFTRAFIFTTIAIIVIRTNNRAIFSHITRSTSTRT